MFLKHFLYISLITILSTYSVKAQVIFESYSKIVGNDTLPYRILPPDRNDPGRKFPLIVFLHGSGARGNDNAKQLKNLPETFIDETTRQYFPCYLLAPQCPRTDSWANFPDFPQSLHSPDTPTTATKMTLELIEELINKLNIDTQRIYITGYSMGGEGSFDILTRKPGRFAAAVPVCPVADTGKAHLVKDENIWVFHGTDDSINAVVYSRLMVNKLRRHGGLPRYTEYAGVGHNCWDNAYKEPDLLPWMFSHVKTESKDFVNKPVLTQQDTLRGSITPGRVWWDALHYDITIQPFFELRTIKGSNIITYKVKENNNNNFMQIDLQSPLTVDSVVADGKPVKFTKDGNGWYIMLQQQRKGTRHSICVYYSGIPHVAKDAPGDGGFSWERDSLQRPWIATSCQGIGASIWYPCKDHQSDEPDRGATIRVIVPDSLVAVSNGKLLGKRSTGGGTVAYKWGVTNPINNYGIAFYVGKYIHIHDEFKGLSGTLTTDYWVLDYNKEKARTHLVPNVVKTLKCYERWMGSYPFYKDGFKMVDAPYIGMEHQSAIAYGNQYKYGFKGKDISKTGWGLSYDILIAHEIAHEWFGNSISTSDLADKWIHEGFAGYAEILYISDNFGIEAGNQYLIAKRNSITNKVPVIPRYGVNETDGSDNFAKGRAIVHMIRHSMNDDSKFRNLLHSMNKKFHHRVTTSEEVEGFICKESGIDFTKMFEQFLHTTQIPVFEYFFSEGTLKYRFTNCVNNFTMPLKLNYKSTLLLTPTTDWQEIKLGISNLNELNVDANYYVEVKRL